jgi:HAD superfamily hydrolase (TIGR01509 family)
MHINTVIFDIGGVLVQTADVAPRRAWEARLNLPEWGLAGHVFDSAASQQAFVGIGDADEVWAEVCAALQVPDDEREALARDFWAGDRVHAPTLAIALALAGRYRLGILSNAWRDMQARDSRRLPFSRFDAVVYSCDIGIRKPAADSYLRALRSLDASPEHTLFIDDFAENVAAAAALGIHGLQYSRDMDLRAALAECGVTVDIC